MLAIIKREVKQNNVKSNGKCDRANTFWGLCWKGVKKLSLNFANLSKQIK